jgi:hypothetical protein
MKQLIILLILITAHTVNAQTFRISYEPGYGLYSLTSLKTFQRKYATQINELPIKPVVQFPTYINHLATFCFYMDKDNLLGINIGYYSTGGRNSLVDYSGEYKFDMLLNSHQVGIESEHIKTLKNDLKIHLNFKLGIINSVLKYSETLNIIGIDKTTNSDEYEQFDFFIEPNITVSKNIFQHLAISTSLGYNLNTNYFRENYINWSGLRPRIGLRYSF